MIRNYVTVAVRSLWRDPLTTSINVIGLSVAIATCILFGVGLHYELTMDSFYQDEHRLYRVIAREVPPNGEAFLTSMQRRDLPEHLEETFPEIEATTRMIQAHALAVVGNRHHGFDLLDADPTFLTMFPFPLAAGTVDDALSNVDQIVISKTFADLMFAGTFSHYEDLLGRTVELKGTEPNDVFVVSGVLDDLPKSRSIEFEAIVRMENWEKFGFSNSWDSQAAVFVKLKEGVDREAFEAKLPAFSRDFAEPRLKNYVGVRWKDEPNAFTLSLQDVRDIHFADHIRGSYFQKNSMDLMMTIAGVALSILAIACINFTTLAIARSSARTMEVGVRKVLGARRGQLIAQFCGEGVLMAVLGVASGVVLAELLLPSFNALITVQQVGGVDFALQDVGGPVAVAGVMFVIVVVGVVAGSYPAFIASRFQPTEAVRGSGRSSAGRHRVTTLLMTVQYGMAIALIVSTIVMVRQLDYVQSRDLGYAAEQVVVVNLGEQSPTERGLRFKAAASGLAGVERIGLSDRSFTDSHNTGTVKRPSGDSFWTHQYKVDQDFLLALGIPLLEGRMIRTDSDADSKVSIVVNRAFVERHGGGIGVGSTVKYGGYGLDRKNTIVGVLDDFHFHGLQNRIEPLLFHHGPRGPMYHAMVRISTDDVAMTLDRLRDTWTTIAPDLPFDYRFLDEDFARHYSEEIQINRLVGAASVVAILIAVIGLFGQASLSVTRRTKEIGVRKVLGATLAQIIALLSRDFAKLVIAANLIAWPIAYYAMSGWLDEFAYRIPLSPLLFVAGGMTALVVALGTVGWLGVRAARGNPVEALRYE